jgi:hypothetical protein
MTKPFGTRELTVRIRGVLRLSYEVDDVRTLVNQSLVNQSLAKPLGLARVGFAVRVQLVQFFAASAP